MTFEVNKAAFEASDKQTSQPMTLAAEQLGRLVSLVRSRGYQVLGPSVRDDAITYAEITSANDLPAGWTDTQGPATYRVSRHANRACFDFNSPMQSWKRFLHVPSARLVAASRAGKRMTLTDDIPAPTKRALLGVHPCDLRAIAIQDKVLLGGPYRDPLYSAYRENLLIIAVNCTRAGGTCFCASLGTGPRATGGFDIALTEITDASRRYYVAQAGSDTGANLLAELAVPAATADELDAEERAIANAAAHMGRTIDTHDLKQSLYRNTEHRRWQEVGERCLNCANCTSVCPTCFCTTINDTTDLAGNAERWRTWDSCFTLEYSYIHGGSIRTSNAARYRQWLTHKFGTWQDQFGVIGCVGCGRCITWCPVGIDVTEEISALTKRETIGAGTITKE